MPIMKNSILSFVIFLISTPLFSQTLEGAFPISGSDIVNTWLTKTDAEGNTYAFGDLLGNADLDPGDGQFNFIANSSMRYTYVIKLNPLGQLVWAKTFSATGTGFNSAIPIISADFDSENNLVLAGNSNSPVTYDNGSVWLNGANSGYFLATLSPLGELLWSLDYNSSVMGIKLASTNEIYVSTNFGNISTSARISKLSMTGTLLWSKTYSNNYVGFNTGDNSLAVDSQDNVCIVGSYDFALLVDTLFYPSAGSYDNFVIKLDPAGNELWTKTFGNAGSDWVYHVAFDADDNLYYCGSYSGTIDMDPGAGVAELTGADGGYITKLDANGNFVWTIGGDNLSYSRMHIGPNNTLLTIGSIAGNGDLNPDSLLELNVPPVLPYASFFASYDVDGHYIKSIFTSKVIYGFGEPDAGHIHLFCNLDGHWDYPDSLIVASNAGDIWELNLTDVTTSYLLRVSNCDIAGCMDPLAFNYNPLAQCEAPCMYEMAGDFNVDGQVDIVDLNMLLEAYECNTNCAEFDLDNDGTVGFSDVLLFISLED